MQDTQTCNPIALYNGQFYLEEVTNEIPTQYIIKLFNSAKESICLSASLSDFYKKDDVISAFSAALNRSDSVKILFDLTLKEYEAKQQDPKFGWFFELLKTNKEKIITKLRNEQDEIEHWIIIDDNHMRLEKPHKPDAIKMSNLIVYNIKQPKVNKTATLLSTTIFNIFARWWDNGQTCPP